MTGRELFLTHGHIFGVGFHNSVDNLPAAARRLGHRVWPHARQSERRGAGQAGIWAFNPGSVSIPKDGSHSFGIYESGKPLAEAFTHVVLEEA